MSHGNPYAAFVADHLRLLDQGRRLPLGGLEPPPRPSLPASAPRVLLLSPHPDDECVTGALALRLAREAKMRVVNLAVTLGSKQERRPGRLTELKAACRHLGFKLVLATPDGFDAVTPKARTEDPVAWRQKVATIRDVIARERPAILALPHAGDRHPAHVGTHHLGFDALQSLGGEIALDLVETEFWGAMPDPNLMVEVPPADLADLLAALACHAGEVRRNPYHLRLPAHMIDNVRRGAETVLPRGSAAPDMTFAGLYRLRRWQDGRVHEILEQGGVVTDGQGLRALFAA